MKNTILIITGDGRLVILPLNKASQIKIYWNDYNVYELVYIPLEESALDLILYESKDKNEIVEVRNYLFEQIFDDKRFIDLSDMFLDLVEDDE